MNKAKKIPKYVLTFPEPILNDERLSTGDMFLIALIIVYDGKDGCFASNGTLAKILHCSVGTISKSISKMMKLGYIIINEENEDHGGRGYIRRVRSDLKLHTTARHISNSRNIVDRDHF